jgi:hypothetical protein
MSSPAFLYAADGDALGISNRNEAFSLYANLTIPVFWLALYEPVDVRRSPDAEPNDFAAWYLSAPTGAAINRLDKRREYLVQALPVGSEAVLSMFSDFLKHSTGLHVQCNPHQALSIQNADDGWGPTLGKILTAFDAPPHHVVQKKKFFKTVEVKELTAGWTNYFRYFGKLHEAGDENPAQLAAALAGWGDTGDTPWNRAP